MFGRKCYHEKNIFPTAKSSVKYKDTYFSGILYQGDSTMKYEYLTQVNDF